VNFFVEGTLPVIPSTQTAQEFSLFSKSYAFGVN